VRRSRSVLRPHRLSCCAWGRQAQLDRVGAGIGLLDLAAVGGIFGTIPMDRFAAGKLEDGI